MMSLNRKVFMDIVFLIIIQIVLIALNAVFASAELAVLSISDARMEKLAEQGNKKAKRLFKLTRNPAKFLSTIQIAITLSGFLGSAFAADGFSEPLVAWLISLGVTIPESTLQTIAVIVITLILSYFTLVFGELVPKRVAIKKSEPLAMGISPLICGISVLFKPVVSLLSVSTNLVLRLIGIDPNEEDDAATEEEIRMLVELGGAKGTINKQEQKLIQNVFEFNDTTAGEAATHRKDIVSLWLEDSDDEWEKTIYENTYSFYPVCEETPDDIVGILDVNDYFRLRERTRENVMATLKPAYFVPENVKADVLFRSMKEKRQPLAVVIDEYGGVIGIVTLLDLVEELVGEFDNDPVKPRIEQVDGGCWNVFGNVGITDVEQAVGAELSSDDFETISGFLFNQLGYIPEDGTNSVELTALGFGFEITGIANHQIESAVIKKLTSDKPETEK